MAIAIFIGLLAVIGLALRASGASASRSVATAAAPVAAEIGIGSTSSGWRGQFAKSLATRGSSISSIADPLDAIIATREAAFLRDIVVLVAHETFQSDNERVEKWAVGLARSSRPRTFHQKLTCTVCLVVGGPGVGGTIPQARLRSGVGWNLIVTAFDTSTHALANMPPVVLRNRSVSLDVVTAMQEAATTLALAASSPESDLGPELKACPDCAENVRSAAKKCRFCGYHFPDGVG